MLTNLPVLPWDIFEHILIPDILSDHIHCYLVDREAPTWHPFYVLPLVSSSFNETCQKLIPKIFGVDLNGKDCTKEAEENDSDSDGFDSDDENPQSILVSRYEYASIVCQRAFRPGTQVGQTYHAHSRATLMGQRNLIGVYTCFALGKIFLNIDVLQPLGILSKQGVGAARTHTTLWDEDYEDYDESALEPTKFDEGNIHRCFMPFESAQQICDIITPERLAYRMAEYMAGALPVYHSIPVFTKYELDLRFTVARRYYFNITDYTTWTYDTIRGLENGEKLLTTMMSRGISVTSYWRNRGIPANTIEWSNIIDALDKVVGADWGNESDTRAIRTRAAALIRRWTRV